VFARLLSRDAAGRPVQSEMVWSPNAVRTTRTWDQDNGRLLQMETTGPGGSTSLIERHVYDWDGFGNLSTRATTYPVTGTTTATMSESFTYDALHRLTGVSTTTANTGQVLTRSFTYNGIGNLTSRSDVGTYTYPTSGQGVARPHTPTSIAAAGGAPFALTTTFTYDADGNMLTGAGRTATWTSFAMPATISLGGQELRWLYGPERQRIRETLTGAAHTLHVAGFAGAYWERRLNVTTNVATVTNYLSFGGETVALVTETSTSPGALTTLWQLKDHLGSTTTLLDASGLISGTRKSYDVWGKRRHVTGEDDTTNSIVSASSRDFTGHEFLEELRLVHMGGRIYDPVVARFLSPDPFVQDPFNLQNLNRYSYVLNNPLAYTDPDGFFFKSISKAFGKLQRFFQRTPIAALAVGIGTAWLLGPGAAGLFDFFTIQSAIVAGTVTGALTDGLRGAIFGAVSGAVTFGIGELGLGFLGEAAFLGKAGLHGVAQGALAEARGGEFGPAFLAASFAHAAGSGLADIDALKGDGFEKVVARTAAASVVGGTASVIGGGKFQNGAATAAFVHLFNSEASLLRKILQRAGIIAGALDLYRNHFGGLDDEGYFPSRSAAFNAAKRDAGIAAWEIPNVASVPMTDRSGRLLLDANGRQINTREYRFERHGVVIQDHSAGHIFPDGGRIGPHFNIRHMDATTLRRGSPEGTLGHYMYRRAAGNE
jgi:RHS repeat-associated protein